MKAFLGALEFQENEYEELKELYESLKTKQKPHTLFHFLRGFTSRA
ncbi:hypothetical protein BD0027_00780 [Helicobacter pylori]